MCKKSVYLISFILVLALAGNAWPWGSQTIGTQLVGNATENPPGTWTVQGDGDDIWGTTDNFHYVYKYLKGDGSITARVANMASGSSEWGKAGVMMRETLTGPSTDAYMVQTVASSGGTAAGGGGSSWQYRLSTSGGCANTDSAVTVGVPLWVRVERVGDAFTGYRSYDNVTWTQVGTTQTIQMRHQPGEPYVACWIGLCVTSHASGELRTAVFDNISFTGDVSEGPPAGPVAYWSFDNPSDPGHDDSDNGHDGTVNGAVSADGICGKALYFDGSSYVDVASAAGLNPTSAITITAWFKANSFNYGYYSWPNIVSKRDNDGSHGYTMEIQQVYENNPCAGFGVELEGQGHRGVPTGVGTPKLEENNWYFAAAVYDGSILKVYVGTSELSPLVVTSANGSGNIVPSSNNLWIGNAPVYGDRSFDGIIDDVRIYNIALTAAEIQNLYTTCPETEWSFVQISDTHIGWWAPWPPSEWTYLLKVNEAENRLFDVINHINNNVSPDLILVTGDIIENAWYNIGPPSLPIFVPTPYYSRFLDVVDSVRDKMYSAPGNHDRYAYSFPLVLPLFTLDLTQYDKYIKQPPGSTSLIPPHDYAFVHKDLTFVGLDSGTCTWPDVRGTGISDAQNTALRDTNKLDPTTAKVFFMHHPVFNDDDNWTILNKTDFVDYCKYYNGKIILTGHTHKSYICDSEGLPLVIGSTEYPQFIQTPSCTKDDPSYSHGYRVFDVKQGLPYPREYTPVGKLNNQTALLYSPAELHAFDSIGRHVGNTPSGDGERGIPKSFYLHHYVVQTADGNETLPEKIRIYDPCDDIFYEVIGSGKGNYRLEIMAFEDGNETVFEANGIPTLPGAVHDYLIDWDLLAQGSNGVTLLVDADGDGTFERTITSDSNLTAVEFDQKPIANAGPDQTVYAWINGTADVVLDGSGSSDPDGDEITYRWLENGQEIATGVNSTVKLSAGVHTIQLVVNDGLADSAADDVNVTVIAPVQGNLCVMPSTINRRSNQPHILAAIELDNIAKSDINANESLTLYPGGIKAAKQWLITFKDRRGKLKTTIFAFFDKDALMAAVPRNGITPLKVAGKLKSGQYFYGCDTVRIIDWKWQWPWWQW